MSCCGAPFATTRVTRSTVPRTAASRFANAARPAYKPASIGGSGPDGTRSDALARLSFDRLRSLVRTGSAARTFRRLRGVDVKPKHLLGIGLAVAAALLTSACAAGQQAATANAKTTLDGVNADLGTIHIRGLVI